MLSACGDDAGSAASTTATHTNEPVTITLLTHDSFAVSDGLLDGFTEQTGITVKVLQAGDAGEMVNQAILTKGKPLGDVLYGVDNTFLGRAVDAGIFEPYSSPAMSDVRAGIRRPDRRRRGDADRRCGRVPQLRQGLVRRPRPRTADRRSTTSPSPSTRASSSSRTPRHRRRASRSCSARSTSSVRMAGSTTGSS